MAVAVAVMLCLVTATRSAEAEAAWSVGFGALFGIKPDIQDRKYAFALTAHSEYLITDPLWLSMGARFAVNHKYFGWAIQPGLMVKFEAGHGLEPTLRAHILVGSQHMYSDFTSFNYFLGGTFGPGLRYRLEALAIFLDISLELAAELPGFDSLYFAVVPVFGLEF